MSMKTLFAPFAPGSPGRQLQTLRRQPVFVNFCKNLKIFRRLKIPSTRLILILVLVHYIGTMPNVNAQSNNLMYIPSSGNEINPPGTLCCITTGADRNASFGVMAGEILTSGPYNSIFGCDAAYNITDATKNTIFGYGADYPNNSGSNTLIIGSEAGYDNIMDNNHFCGLVAGQNNSNTHYGAPYGENNTFIGCHAGEYNDDGYNNQFIGFQADRYNVSGWESQCEGYQAGVNMTGISQDYLSGFECAYNGNASGLDVVIGFQSNYNSNDISNDTYIGAQVAYNNGHGQECAYYGYQAGYASTSGHEKSFFGASTGPTDATGYNLTLLGYGADVGVSNIYNATAIGYNTRVQSANEMRFGNGSVTQWGLGVDPASGHALEVGTNATNGNGAYCTLTGTWVVLSDRNKKENFTEPDGNEILLKVDKLAIPRWNYKGDDPMIQHIGPMAQDFYGAFNVGNDNVSISTIDPAGIALVSIKMLSDQNKVTQIQNTELAKKANDLSTQNLLLQQKIGAAEQTLASRQTLLADLSSALDKLRDAQNQCCGNILNEQSPAGQNNNKLKLNY